ncbi:hypothetical protein [Enterobacter mori]
MPTKLTALRLVIHIEKMVTSMPNPFDFVMFVLLVSAAAQEMGWLPW